MSVSPRILAHVGDAVFHLFERERIAIGAVSARQMHAKARVSAQMQADLLEKMRPALDQRELELVRRARNMKATGYRRGDQSSYRQATAFEALLGFLYLSDLPRLKHLLDSTLAPGEPESGDSSDDKP
ncbi:MAG: ribonuclease III domain-containing protein [Terriglobales bacterium]